MKDLHNTFAEMASNEREGTDFTVECTNRASNAVILAIHGGAIEEHTDKIARHIAGQDLSYYLLVGTRPAGNQRHLHIASARFDDPRAVALVRDAQTVISIHGEESNTDAFVLLGGRDAALRNRITQELQARGFTTRDAPEHLAGLDPSNICNRGLTGQGVQLEFSKVLRVRLAGDPIAMQSFVEGMRAALTYSGQ